MDTCEGEIIMTTGELDISGLISVADNDRAFTEAFSQMLEIHGYRTVQVNKMNQIIDCLSANLFDLLTLDLDWETADKNGIDILQEVQRFDPLLPVVIITGQATIQTAIEATKLGAFDYIEKLHNRDKALLTIKNAIESGRLKRQNRAFLMEMRNKYELIGNSSAMEIIRDQIRKAGPIDSVVLITGESGTGKELVARQIHYHSKRMDKKFVCVDSGTLADSLAESELFGHRKGAFTGAYQDRKGLFEEAEGGTIFLDEISNATSALQSKLLHVIQEREFRRVGENEMRKSDVRIIAATNQCLPEIVKESKFRNDLYYRLKVIEIVVPPLKDRKEDIPMLTQYFVKMKSHRYFGGEKKLSPDALNMLVSHDWPGNVRELENAMERLVILAEPDQIGVTEVQKIFGDISIHKPFNMKPLNDLTREFRRECVIKAMTLAEGKVAKAAEILQIDRTHLYKLIDEYQLKTSL
jgi:two-component system nitrogen regulation response regulator NtrX